MLLANVGGKLRARGVTEMDSGRVYGEGERVWCRGTTQPVSNQ